MSSSRITIRSRTSSGAPAPAPAPASAPARGPAAAKGGFRPVAGITEREREVLTLVGRGRSNADRAEELFLSVATATGTATSHVARLFSTLGARDRVHLVTTAYGTGLLAPPP
ncbi:response regulator transcription factor [Streptomyces sp. NPDC056224]|uniref:response regulator transcription factor n=1 Tax=Streptomyces sp. NPDC056224 TaxID=3345750 RepID=UPI0035DF5499